jgi:hypothetical protein
MKDRTLARGAGLQVTATFVVVFFLFFSPRAEAALYQPGATLDPSCLPADPTCGVATTTYSGGVAYNAGTVTNTGLLSITPQYGSALTGALTLATSTAGAGFSITSSGSTITFNLPAASASATGLLSSSDWSTFNAKQAALTFTYPFVDASNAVSLAFGTSTSNAWSGLQLLNGGATTTELTSTGNAYLATLGGDVGIGTTSPFALLSVGGNAYVSGTTTLNTLLTQTIDGGFNTDQFPTIQSAINAAGTTGYVTITPLTTDTSSWDNPNGLTIIDTRPTTRVGQFLGGASVTPKLANFANGSVANKKIVYFGNSTVWNATSWFTTMAEQDVPGGLLQGMNIHQDVQSVSADSNADVTVALGSPSGFTVGQFVTVEPTNNTLSACVGSGIVTAVSGDQFTFTGEGTDAQCTNVATTSTGGTATQQLLNFGNNGGTLASMLANTASNSTGIGGICSVKPDLLIIRGPLINDVRTGSTNLAWLRPKRSKSSSSIRFARARPTPIFFSSPRIRC